MLKCEMKRKWGGDGLDFLRGKMGKSNCEDGKKAMGEGGVWKEERQET